jgi:hypothetical protein
VKRFNAGGRASLLRDKTRKHGILTGNVIGECSARHSAAEYRAFLKKVDAGYPKKQVLHINTDNYTTDKTQAIRSILKGSGGGL